MSGTLLQAGGRFPWQVPSRRQRRIGDCELERLIEEGGDYQDFQGHHVAAGVRRRIRIFQNPPGRSRDDVFKAVARKFQILEGISHPGILRASDLPSVVPRWFSISIPRQSVWISS